MQTNSLERIVPDQIHETRATGQQALALHLDRYRFAATHSTAGRILDIACGVGYGTNLLFDSASGCQYALGLDTDQDSITYASNRYQQQGLEFVVDDAMTFSGKDPFDSIITLETIEHLPDPEGFISHLTSLLRPGGMLIVSVPTTPTVDANPYHLHDFTKKSFRTLASTFPLKNWPEYPRNHSFRVTPS